MIRGHFMINGVLSSPAMIGHVALLWGHFLWDIEISPEDRFHYICGFFFWGGVWGRGGGRRGEGVNWGNLLSGSG